MNIAYIYLNNEVTGSEVDKCDLKFDGVGVCLDNDYTYAYNKESRELTVRKKSVNTIKENFYGQKVNNIKFLLGKNGTGKSTILKTIMGEVDQIDSFVVLRNGLTFIVEDLSGLVSNIISTDSQEIEFKLLKSKQDYLNLKNADLTIVHFRNSRFDNNIILTTNNEMSPIEKHNNSMNLSTPDDYDKLISLYNEKEYLQEFLKKELYLFLRYKDIENLSKDLNPDSLTLASLLFEFYIGRTIKIDKTDYSDLSKDERKEKFIMSILRSRIINHMAAIISYNIFGSVHYMKNPGLSIKSDKTLTDMIRQLRNKESTEQRSSSHNTNYFKIQSVLNDIEDIFNQSTRHNVDSITILKEVLKGISLEKRKLVSNNDYDFELDSKILCKMVEMFERIPNELFKESTLILYNNDNTEYFKDLSAIFTCSRKNDVHFDSAKIVKKQLWREMGIKLPYLSTGEERICMLISSIYSTISASEKVGDITILLDEPEDYLHLEWSRKFMYNLIDVLEKMSDDINNIQLIVASHSPIMTSDVIGEDVILLENTDANGKVRSCVIKHQEKKTFAGNIHEIINDSFYLKTTKGEFAKSKIKEKFEDILSYSSDVEKNREKYKKIDYEEIKELEYIINEIGDKIVKKILKNALYDYMFKTEKVSSKVSKLHYETSTLTDEEKKELVDKISEDLNYD